MTTQESNLYKIAIFNMYSHINLFVNTDTGEELKKQRSFNGTNFYLDNSRADLSTTAIILKKLKTATQKDLYVISSLSSTNFNNLNELYKHLNNNITFKESILFYNIFIQLGIALPYLSLSVADLETNKIIVCGYDILKTQ